MPDISFHCGGRIHSSEMPIGDDFKDPADDRIARAEFKQEHGRKWSAKTSVDKAKSMLHLLGITGITSTGH